MKIKVAGIALTLPDGIEPRAAEAAAAEVAKRIAAAEASSSRIDTLAFALSAALSLAAELQDSEDARRADAEETARALTRIAAELDELQAALQPDED